MFAWKVAPALAAGNTVVIKPAMQTPLTGLTAFAELAMKSTYHPTCSTFSTCDDKSAQALVEHPDYIGKVSLHRLDEVGPHHPQSHRQLAAQAFIRKLGGKSPFVVFDVRVSTPLSKAS